MIKGIGIDILEIKRFASLYSKWGDKLINKIFNEDELLFSVSKKRVVESLSGKFAVIDLISGTFIWEIPIKTSNDSIINGDSVFISSDDGRVINILKNNGEVRWIANIYETLKVESNGTPLCSTPILAKSDIILSCYDGNVFKINSSNGDYEKLFNLGEASFISPIIINGYIIFYTEDAELIVYR